MYVLIKICVGRVLIVIRYFLLKKKILMVYLRLLVYKESFTLLIIKLEEKFE